MEINTYVLISTYTTSQMSQILITKDCSLHLCYENAVMNGRILGDHYKSLDRCYHIMIDPK